MIHLLAVDRDGPRALAAPPSFEVLWAHSPEDALEKLSRNRRIDAVLFFDGAAARETLELLSAEDAPGPPLFCIGPATVAGTIALELAGVFDELRRWLGE